MKPKRSSRAHLESQLMDAIRRASVTLEHMRTEALSAGHHCPYARDAARRYFYNDAIIQTEIAADRLTTALNDLRLTQKESAL